MEYSLSINRFSLSEVQFGNMYQNVKYPYCESTMIQIRKDACARMFVTILLKTWKQRLIYTKLNVLLSEKSLLQDMFMVVQFI